MKYLELYWRIYSFSPENVTDLNKLKNLSKEQGRAIVEAYGDYTHKVEANHGIESFIWLKNTSSKFRIIPRDSTTTRRVLTLRPVIPA